MRSRATAPDLPSLDVLVVDDEPGIRRTMTLHLEGRGHRVAAAATAAEALGRVAAGRFDVVFLDLRLGTESGLDLLPRLLAADPRLKVVVITAYASVETAVEAMRRGARDYLAKPFTPDAVDLALSKVSDLARLERRVEALEGTLDEVDPLALESAAPAMRAAVAVVRQVAPSDARLLLRGESGTGKGVIARAVHRLSPRRERPFVTVSCPALPAELLESELFGHVRGAFTGAGRDNPGRVALAEGGTLLLDEIGDLPLALQPKLLRFIQDREYERVGDPAPRRADVRILAATNQDLERAAEAGRFREDLLYRLNVVTVEIPPLRERQEDVLPLAERFLDLARREVRRPGLHLSDAARRALLAHSWPGNVRELRNAVERAAMLAPGEEVGAENLGIQAGAHADRSKHGPAVGDLVSLEALEEEHIRRVIARTASLSEAASVLGIDQATLWRRRKQYGI